MFAALTTDLLGRGRPTGPAPVRLWLWLERVGLALGLIGSVILAARV